MKNKSRLANIDTGDLELLDLIEVKGERFTPAQRIVAEYLMHHPESLLFMSIQELAEKAEVSQATIVRFCNVLGYDGYGQLTKEAQQIIQSQLGTAGRFNLVRGYQKSVADAQLGGRSDSVFLNMLKHEIENLNRLSRSIKIEDFNRAVRLILKADGVVIIGCMASSSLACHFGNMLCKVFPNVDVVDSDGVRQTVTMSKIGNRTTVCLIAFPRYPSTTVAMGEAAASTGADIICITDNHASPISQMGDVSFHIPVGLFSFVDAYAAPLTFINALCAEVAEQLPDKTAESLNRFDHCAVELNTFSRQIRRGRPRKIEKSKKTQ